VPLPPDISQRHRVRVPPGAKYPARTLVGHSPIGHDLATGDEDVFYPERTGRESLTAAGKIVHELRRLTPHLGGIEDTEIGMPARSDPAPLA